MPRERHQGQHCGRHISVNRLGVMRPHNDPFWDEPCGPRIKVDVPRKRSFFTKPVGETVELPEPPAPLREGSLFSGYGGLSLAAGELLGAEPAWFVENERAAANVLEHHWPGVPNLGDITAIDWSEVEPVDVLTAGWPCQPWSTAGQRKGIEDERALWPEVARALCVLRPGIVLLENVPGIVTAGELERVANTLAALGYEFAWTVLGAGDVGLPHRRNRIFIAAADPACDGRHEGRPEPAGVERGLDAALGGERAAAKPGAAIADSDGGGRRGNSRDAGWNQVRRDAADRDSAAGLDWGQYGPAIDRAERVIGRRAPTPTTTGARGARVLAPEFPEWMMGLPEGWVTAVPGLSRNEQLKLIGNGVCPQQAVAAYASVLPLLASPSEVAA